MFYFCYFKDIYQLIILVLAPRREMCRNKISFVFSTLPVIDVALYLPNVQHKSSCDKQCSWYITLKQKQNLYFTCVYIQVIQSLEIIKWIFSYCNGKEITFSDSISNTVMFFYQLTDSNRGRDFIRMHFQQFVMHNRR